MSSADITVQIKARLYWKLIFEYPNEDNAGTIVQTYKSRSFTSYKASNFHQTVSKSTTDTLTKAGVQVEAGASYGPVSAKVTGSYESSKEINDMLEDTTSQQSDTTIETERIEDRTYTVGAHSTLKLYQQYFEGPGMSAGLDTFSTDAKRDGQSQDVIIDVVVHRIDFIRSFQVIYTDHAADAPSERIREVHGGNEDINAGFKGKFVYLKPVYTKDSTQAATFFDLVIQDSSNAAYSDLAKGAGGAFRFLIPVYNARENKKIVGATLFRSTDASTKPKPSALIQTWGYNDSTIDINKDRKGDYLYLVWKTQLAY